jgi:hypothetical protein
MVVTMFERMGLLPPLAGTSTSPGSQIGLQVAPQRELRPVRPGNSSDLSSDTSDRPPFPFALPPPPDPDRPTGPPPAFEANVLDASDDTSPMAVISADPAESASPAAAGTQVEPRPPIVDVLL